MYNRSCPKQIKKRPEYSYLINQWLSEDEISRLLIEYTFTEIYNGKFINNKWKPESFDTIRNINFKQWKQK